MASGTKEKDPEESSFFLPLVFDKGTNMYQEAPANIWLVLMQCDTDGAE